MRLELARLHGGFELLSKLADEARRRQSKALHDVVAETGWQRRYDLILGFQLVDSLGQRGDLKQELAPAPGGAWT